jgi:hypothetical protein
MYIFIYIYIYEGDYKEAALSHISDKAVRFMRAHLAQIIIDNSPMTTEICMQLVEHSLDFDDSIAVLYRPPLSGVYIHFYVCMYV